jgi:hypothetical protein
MPIGSVAWDTIFTRIVNGSLAGLLELLQNVCKLSE